MLLNHHDHNPDMGDDSRLDALFRAYREACPDPEPGPDFMPRLWQRIEARQKASILFGRLARNLATAALAFTVMMALALSLTHFNGAPYQSYVEVLAEDDAHSNFDNFALVHVEPVSDTGHAR